MKTKPLRILFDAMHHGKYDFDDFLRSDVAASYDTSKFKGRTVYRPNNTLKAYHSFLGTFLCEYLIMNNRVVYSYRKGANPTQAVAVHSESRAFFQTDIEHFFESLDRELVRSTITRSEYAVPISDIDSYIDRIIDLTTVNGAVPIGFSTSPPISNACLNYFDNDLETHCVNLGLIYSRYSDDIVISSQSRESIINIHEVVSELLLRHFNGALKLNKEKTKITGIGRKIKILGMVILPSGKMTIDMDLKSRIEVRLHFYVHNREKFLNLVDNNMQGGIKQLAGYINYVHSVDKPYLDKLRRKFGATVIDSFLYRSAT